MTHYVSARHPMMSATVGLLRPREKRSKVLILGAGIAGIAAARTLHNSGFGDFIILEGSDRIGGRMRHIQWHDSTIELGANWIHGTVNNPIYDLARECGLKGRTERNTYVIRTESGARVTAKGRLVDLKQALERFEEIAELGDMSMGEALKHAGWIAVTPEDMAIEYWLLDYMEATLPGDVYTVVKTTDQYRCKPASNKRNAIDAEDEEQQFFVADARGFVHLTERLAASFLAYEDPRLELNKRIVTVEWGSDGVRVETSAGEVYRAEFALVTFSVGVLRSGVVKFQPPLPVSKQAAISKFKMVHYATIFLKFPYLFWDREAYILHASKQRGYYTVWHNVEAGLPLFRGSSVLRVTVTGSEALRLEKQSSMATQTEIMTVLRKMYGSDIPDPIDVFYHRWGSDELFSGSWANPPVGVSSEDFADLSSPVGRLYFAGEATNEMYHGTVHGAYLSGLTVAERIMKDMRNSGAKADQKELSISNVDENCIYQQQSRLGFPVSE